MAGETQYFLTQDGQVKAVGPSALGIAKDSGWKPLGSDLAVARQAKEAGTIGGQVKTVAEGAAAGAFDAATAVPRLLSAGTAAVTGGPDVLEHVSGRQFLEDIQGVGSELLGVAPAEAAARRYREAQQFRAEVNPGETFASQVAGNVAGGLGLAGGARAAGAAAAARLGGGLAARLGGAALAGAIEGAPLGMTQAQDQAYLEGRQLTAEQAMAHAGIGALLGGAVSAGGTGLAEIFGKAKGAIAGKFASAATEGDGAGLSKVLRTGDGSIDAAGAAALKQEVEPGFAGYVRDGVRGGDLRAAQRAAHEEATTALAEATNDAIATTRKLTDKLDNRAWKLADVETRANSFAPEALEATQARAAAIRQDLEDTLQGLGSDAKKVKIVEGLKARVDAESLKIAGTESPAKAYIAMDQIRRDAAATARSLWESAQQAANVDTKELYRAMAEKVGGHYDDTFKFLMDDGLWGAQGIAQQEANTARAALIQAERAALPNFATKVGKSYEGQGLTRDILEADEGKIIGHLRRMGTTEGAFAERRMAQWLDAADKFSAAAKKYGIGAEDSAAADAVAKSASKFREALATAKEKVGAIEQAQAFLEKAHGGSGAGAGGLLGGMIGGHAGAAAGAVVGAVMNPAKFLTQRIQLEQMAAKTAERFDGAIGRFLRPATSGAIERAGDVVTKAARGAATPSLLGAFGQVAKSPELAFEKRRDSLIQATQNANGGARDVVSKQFGEVADDDPHAYAAAVVTATKALDFLMGKMPSSGPNPSSLTPLASKVVPSRVEIAQFARYWNAVSDPMSVVDNLAKGTITYEEVDAIKTVYPAMYGWMQNETMAKLRKLDAKGVEVPPRTLLTLDSLLDLDGAGMPPFSSEFAAKYSEKMGDNSKPDDEQQQAPAPRPSPGPTGLGKRFQTQTATFLGASL